MALSWNEIRSRALAFSKEWESETRERAEAQSFWNDFFNVFGLSRRRVATFEEPAKKLNEKYGFIDLFWKGNLLVEHKSKDEDLDKAYSQALDYFCELEEHELPKYVLVSDFARFRLYDLDEDTHSEFSLKDLHKHIKLFGFIAGYQKRVFKEEDPVNIKAAELMGKLHDQMKESGYSGHNLEVYLVRLLFCLFADDTGIFEKEIFKEFIENKTSTDGSNLGALLAQFFQILNTPKTERSTNLDEDLAQFPYVDGKLFEESLPIASFESKMRDSLLKCCSLDWGKISPAIFGALFQAAMDPALRRNLGAHYTSEKNILKLIKPLFLDELHKEFARVKGNKKQLNEFHKKLGTLKFLDPACGCGNFLVITYRELRKLELEILRILHRDDQLILDIGNSIWLDVDQFFGMEIEELPARIAEVALWLMDHQMNMLISEEFGQYFARLPLKKSATIINDNSLKLEWGSVIPKNELNYILGNPPFVGKKEQNAEQKNDMQIIFRGVSGAGVLDYVSAWYIKASEFIQNTHIRVAFVSTNSITQGEQVGLLWNELFSRYNVKIHFAHRTFKWSNEASGKAAVHVVIIGFANFDTKDKYIYEYEDVKGEPHERKAQNINPYLCDARDITLKKRTAPLCDVPAMEFGNMANDGGNLIIEEEDYESFLQNEPAAKKFIKPLLGSEEFINSQKRWCLWLKGIDPKELRDLPEVQKRVQAVREIRSKSSRPATQELAKFPTLFGEIRQPNSDYLLIPRVSSENRYYIPIGFVDKNTIVTDRCAFVPNANLYLFGILTSAMHMTWMKYTCGRLKSDYNYSIQIVYNNYPWPKNVSEKSRNQVTEKAQQVLNVRKEFADNSLADLYHPITMPPALVKAHRDLDKAVDLCYRPQAFPNEASRIEHLFELYQQY